MPSSSRQRRKRLKRRETSCLSPRWLTCKPSRPLTSRLRNWLESSIRFRVKTSRSLNRNLRSRMIKRKTTIKKSPYRSQMISLKTKRMINQKLKSQNRHLRANYRGIRRPWKPLPKRQRLMKRRRKRHKNKRKRSRKLHQSKSLLFKRSKMKRRRLP